VVAPANINISPKRDPQGDMSGSEEVNVTKQTKNGPVDWLQIFRAIALAHQKL
jgi:hypothetical protein